MDFEFSEILLVVPGGNLKCGGHKITAPTVRKIFGASFLERLQNAKSGVPKPVCFKPGCLQFLRGCSLLRSFAPLCTLLRSSADLRLRSFACFCIRPRLERPRLGTGDKKKMTFIPASFRESAALLSGP